MSRPSFLFRPDLRKADHQQAWEMLDAQPSGFKNEFLVQAVLCAQRQEALETMLRRVVAEQLKSVVQDSVITMAKEQTDVQADTQSNDSLVPDFMLDFLGELEL